MPSRRRAGASRRRCPSVLQDEGDVKEDETSGALLAAAVCDTCRVADVPGHHAMSRRWRRGSQRHAAIYRGEGRFRQAGLGARWRERQKALEGEGEGGQGGSRRITMEQGCRARGARHGLMAPRRCAGASHGVTPCPAGRMGVVLLDAGGKWRNPAEVEP